MLYLDNDYSEEGKKTVKAFVTEAMSKIANANTVEEIKKIVDDTKEKLKSVEERETSGGAVNFSTLKIEAQMDLFAYVNNNFGKTYRKKAMEIIFPVQTTLL